MVVVAGKKHRSLVEKRRRQRVDDGVGLAGARRALHVGQRAAHGVVDGQQLVQIDLVVQQRQRVGLAAARPAVPSRRRRLAAGRWPSRRRDPRT